MDRFQGRDRECVVLSLVSHNSRAQVEAYVCVCVCVCVHARARARSRLRLRMKEFVCFPWYRITQGACCTFLYLAADRLAKNECHADAFMP